MANIVYVKHNHYGFWKFIGDLFLGVITGGLWWMYLLFKGLRK